MTDVPLKGRILALELGEMSRRLGAAFKELGDDVAVTKNLSTAKEQVEMARVALRNAENLVIKLEREHRQDTLKKLWVVGDGTVIRFTKNYGGYSPYMHVAIKVGPYWYISQSGDTNRVPRKTTEELIEWIGQGRIALMTTDKELV